MALPSFVTRQLVGRRLCSVSARGMAAALAVLLSIAGCQAIGAQQAAAPQKVIDALANECAAPLVDVSSPLRGADLSAHEFPLLGITGRPGSTLLWHVMDAHGAVVSEGSVRSSDDGRFRTWLDLPDGAYTVVLQLAGAGFGGTVDPCRIAGTQLTVGAHEAGRTWVSGASGSGVPDGRFASWRGSPVAMAGSWADNNWAAKHLPQLQPGGEYGDWRGDLDLAVGALGEGETWAAAAQGAYDARWGESLQLMARLWAGRPGTLYIRFAHEFNGNWYPWGVTAATVPDFVASWKRYRALQQQYVPFAKLVMTPNWETGPAQFDWRTAFPGPEYVDVLSIPYFNRHPPGDTAEQFAQVALSNDRFGAPRGLQRHIEFARSVGLPFAVSEWGSTSRVGDSPMYIEQMHQFFRANAGRGPGQLLYEIYFNVERDDNAFALMPTTNVPISAEIYRALW